jgi:dihydrofolate synthase/folylpolyglutamate synthase
MPKHYLDPALLTERPSHFDDFAAFAAYLDKLGLFRMLPGQERMIRVLDALGLRRPPFALIQVVGTNGKGSTCAMLESLVLRHGLRVGLHSSPHFINVRERVRLNRAALPEERWTALADRLLEAGGSELSYFECVTCLAVLAFAEAGVDLAVMETGLGGRFDATTALEADLVAFTPIDLDHQAVLGNSLAAIAADKAGAVRPGKPVLSAPQKAEAARAIALAARERSAPLRVLGPEESATLPAGLADMPRRLPGQYQNGNYALALAVWHELLAGEALSVAAKKTVARHASATSEAEGLAGAWLPGRLQRIAPAPADASGFPCPAGWPHMLLDGGHNLHGLAALGHSLAEAGIAPGAVIFACLEDKRPERLVPHLRALAAGGPIFVPPIQNNPRAMDPAALATLIGLNAAPAASLQEALRTACGQLRERLPDVFSGADCRTPLLVCGSLYLLGECFALRPECLGINL